ncbi:hypothetical protein, partial [Paraburkholderia caledonica]|uniref:hypothetical protein n=1 Tax=Paraburkholderia caledonica TaxID=134536 RepID=UPI003C8529D8
AANSSRHPATQGTSATFDVARRYEGFHRVLMHEIHIVHFWPEFDRLADPLISFEHCHDEVDPTRPAALLSWMREFSLHVFPSS